MKRGGGRVIDEGDRHIGDGDRAESNGSGAAAAARHPGRSKIEGLHGLGHSRTCAGQERPEEERYQAQPIYKGCAGTGGAVTIRTAKQQGIQHPVFSCRAGRAALAEEPYSDLACPKLPMLVSCKGDRLKTPRQETNGDTPFMKNGQKMSGSGRTTKIEPIHSQCKILHQTRCNTNKETNGRQKPRSQLYGRPDDTEMTNQAVHYFRRILASG